jgi:TolB protein
MFIGPKKIFTCLLAGLIFFCAANQCLAIVYIDITSPSFQKFPIAITDFKKTEGDLRKDDLTVWFSDTLGKYLTMTGFFNNINKKAFLENQSQTSNSKESVDFTSWTAIGADYLVKGGYRNVGGNLNAEFRLYDVTKGELIVGKQFVSKVEDKLYIIRQIAREILLALTGDGDVFNTKIAYVMKTGRMSDIYVINFDGANLAKVTNEKSLTMTPRWSPDGQYISYTSYSSGNPDLYIKPLYARTGKKISGFQGINLSGSWSRDGRKILFTTRKDGNEEIYTMEINTGKLERLTNNLSIDVSPAWSPDNTKIAFVSNRSGSPQIYIMNTDGSNVKRLTDTGTYNTSPNWSPNGKKISYEGRVNGRFQIFTINEDGTQNTQLTADYRGDYESPTWSPDGRYLTYSLIRGSKSSIYIMNANGSNVRLLFEGRSMSIGPAWSPRMK